MTENLLLTPVALGALHLPNRVVMSPMSRLRADGDLAPPAFVAEYYGQRATAGLIITEAIAVRNYGDGRPPVPGLYSEVQRDAWRHVIETVHERGGRIVAQLWHVGRPRFEEPGQQRPAGSPRLAEVTPPDLDPSDIERMPLEFAAAARLAREIGFDGVEIHNGSSNLLDRFLRPGLNARSDDYGGSTSNRTRLTRAIVLHVANAVGPERVGIKFSPSAPVGDGADPAALDTFAHLLADLASVGLAYVHATRVTRDDRARGWGEGISFPQLRGMYSGHLIGAGDFEPGEARKCLEDGTLDAAVFGRLFLANPDLLRRIELSAPFNEPDPTTFYTPGPRGLTDYPRLAD